MHNFDDGNNYGWQHQNSNQSYFSSSNDFSQGPTLDFQTFSPVPQNFENQPKTNYQYYDPNVVAPPPELNPTTDFDEPPLLDELEIYPDRILEKTLAVLNPFYNESKAVDANFLLRDNDIAGPVAFCLALALCLFLSGHKAHFGYVYGLSLTSVVLMYVTLTLMSTVEGVFTVLGVASVLGYCMLPMVLLGALGIFVALEGTISFGLTALAVLWSAVSASRLFVTMSGDTQQRPLIAYPCILVYAVFALLILF